MLSYKYLIIIGNHKMLSILYGIIRQGVHILHFFDIIIDRIIMVCVHIFLCDGPECIMTGNYDAFIIFIGGFCGIILRIGSESAKGNRTCCNKAYRYKQQKEVLLHLLLSSDPVPEDSSLAFFIFYSHTSHTICIHNTRSPFKIERVLRTNVSYGCIISNMLSCVNLFQQKFRTNILNIRLLFILICVMLIVTKKLECIFSEISFYEDAFHRHTVYRDLFSERIRLLFMGYGKITAKQQQILDYIKQEILSKGYPPAVREICEAVNLKSTSSVHSHLETLEKNGYIRRDPTKPRAIEICDDNFQMVRTEMVSIPVIGQVAAGLPILAEQNIESYFPVPADMVPGGESFALKVKGDSMINIGIYNGDQIFVKSCQTAKNGDTIVALIDDSATVKTFYKEDGHIRLQPENDSMEPIIVDDCQILGKVFGVFRLYNQ